MSNVSGFHGYAKRGVVLLVVSASLVLSACGGASSGPSAGAVASVPPAPKTGCGSIPLAKPKDPEGALASLGKQYQTGYSGYSTPILKSAWANWKPSHPGPYTVGIQWASVTNDFQRRSVEHMKAVLEKNPMIKNVILQTTGNNLDVGQEIAQLNQLIAKKPDIVILEPLTADSFAPQIKRMADQNIPTIMAGDSFVQGNKNTVSILQNAYAGLATNTAYLMRMLKGKGNVIFFHALASTGVERTSFAGFKDALKRCPNAKLAGELYGDFTAINGKSEFLKFLATHPESFDAVAETSNTSPGVLSALQQTGRPIVPAMMNGANAGSLSYWSQHKDTYRSVGYLYGGEGSADAITEVALRMLDGQGIKITDVTGAPKTITNENVDQFAPKDPVPVFTPTDTAVPKDSFLSPAYIAGLFRSPRDLPNH